MIIIVLPTQRKLHVDDIERYRHNVNYMLMIIIVLPTQRKLHFDDNYRVLLTQRKLHVFCSVRLYPFQVSWAFAARFKLCIFSFV